MKIYFNFFLLHLLLVCTSFAQNQPKDSNLIFRDAHHGKGMLINPSGPDSISVKMKVPHHPRLFLLKGEEKALLKNIKKDAVWTSMHEVII